MFAQKSIRFALFLSLALFAGAGFASGAGQIKGEQEQECQGVGVAECDPDFDDELSLVPHNYDFGGTPVNVEAQPMSYALVNTSGEPVQVGAIAISGEGLNVCMAIGCPVIADGEFYLLSDECSGKTLVDQESCEFEVGFLPSGEGEFLTALWVSFTPTGGSLQTLRGKLGGAGYVDDGGGFSLAGTISLFAPPGGGAILDAIRERAGGESPQAAENEPRVRTQQPLEGVTVMLDNGQSTQTNELGEYRFDGLNQGAYAITPVSDSYRFFPAVRHARINGRDRQGVQFRAKALQATIE